VCNPSPDRPVWAHRNHLPSATSPNHRREASRATCIACGRSTRNGARAAQHDRPAVALLGPEEPTCVIRGQTGRHDGRLAGWALAMVGIGGCHHRLPPCPA
jgi:hypothetical protein